MKSTGRFAWLGVFLMILGAARLHGQMTIEVMTRAHSVNANGTGVIAYELTAVKRLLPHAIEPNPIVFYIQGSSYETVRRSTPFLAGLTALGIPVIVAEKRGINAGGGVDVKRAHAGAGKATRIADHTAVVRAWLERVDKRRPVILIGGSEGGDVAAAVATRVRATHLVLLGCGGGWSQETEIRHLLRKQPGFLGLATEQEFDVLLGRIRTRPKSLEVFAGHPFVRWSSYLFSPPIDDLLKLDIPVLMVHGTDDRSVPVESARAAAAAFRGAGKRNLDLVELEGLDHGFHHKGLDRSGFPLLEEALLKWMRARKVIDDLTANQVETILRLSHPEWFSRGADTRPARSKKK